MPLNKPASDAIQLSMLENGLDFIRSGLKSIASPQTKFDLKYAVLHLSAGIELVLKYRLRREDWTLIFADPEKATAKSLASGNFKSVTLYQRLDRLEEHCPIELPDRLLLESFKNQRNPIEHFEMNHSRDALEAAAAVVLGELIDFIGGAFEENDLSAEESDLLQEIRTLLGEFQQFTLTRMTAIQPLLKDHKKHYGRIVECPSCLQDALMADCNVRCAFCGYTVAAEDAAEFYISNNYGRTYFDPKHDEPERLHRCPNCENVALVYEEGYSESNGVCFACGETPAPGEYVACSECQELCDPDFLCGGRCVDCFNAYIAEDHT